jgi:hypothetical protein
MEERTKVQVHEGRLRHSTRFDLVPLENRSDDLECARALVRRLSAGRRYEGSVGSLRQERERCTSETQHLILFMFAAFSAVANQLCDFGGNLLDRVR